MKPRITLRIDSPRVMMSTANSEEVKTVELVNNILSLNYENLQMINKADIDVAMEELIISKPVNKVYLGAAWVVILCTALVAESVLLGIGLIELYELVNNTNN